MKINKVTDIAIKPSAEGIIASMEAQLKNPKSKQKWDGIWSNHLLSDIIAL